MRRAWTPWLLAVVALAGAAGAPPATLWARLFFVPAVLGALLAALGAFDRRLQLGAAGAALLLTLGQVALHRAIPEPPSSQWTVELRDAQQRARHTIALPLGQPRWGALWARTAEAAAYVCARGPLDAADGLELTLNDVRVAIITQSLAVGPRPQPTSVGFYRVPLTRDALERQPLAVFELRRAAGAGRPIEICGTFTFHPTAGLDSSAFFDGARWTRPGPTALGRFVIELRLEDAGGKPLVDWY